ncbi:MAG: DEAD/DEAH box helicase, partial [Miltoncostaeaceae bacterium]
AFLAALGLHRALLFGAARQMGDTLRAAMDLLGGRQPAGLSPAAALAAWRALFLVVPVVSTTFASLPRVFATLGREDLGWLLVDEAAQVSPHEAVGGIWRSRRLVALGDPRQLEPIVTLPAATQEGLRTRHGVTALWSPASSSVQRLADRACPEGTADGDGPDAPWVGLPLTRHRRCEEPMFAIVNRMAYGGRMVNATPRWEGPRLPPSGWLDVRGSAGDGHWVPEEGERLQGVLAHLDLRGVAAGEMLVLTPFRDVARRLEEITRHRPGLAAGTVHTAQGREADIVVLVLGAGPAHPGAMRWATASPNLLNVAVSRARRRLWVIGDHASWSRLPHARVIADSLPVKGP